MNNIEFLSEDISPLLQVCLESEMSWNNIMQESYVEEFIAIKNEDVSTEEKSNESTKQKILQWIKDKINALKIAMKNLLTNIVAKRTNLDEFLEKISVDELPTRVTVEIRDWNIKSFGDISLSAIRDMSKISEQLNPEEIKSISDMYSTDNYKFLSSNKLIKENAMVMSYYKSLTDFNKSQNLVKSSAKLQTASLNKMKIEINKPGARTKIVDIYKKQTTAIDKITNYSLSCMFKYMADCLKVIRKAKSQIATA